MSEAGRSRSFLEKTARALAFPAAVISGVVAFGLAEGNKEGSGTTVDVALRGLVEPKATRIGEMVLDVNKKRRPNLILTRPDDDGSEFVSMYAWTMGKWVTFDAAMFRDENGQLDPTTTNYVDIHIHDCNKKGCGGSGQLEEEIELIYGNEETFTRGNWGVKDNLRLPNETTSGITVDSATRDRWETTNTADAQHALLEARVFSGLALVWANEALRGQVEIPKLKKIKHKST